MSDDTFFDFGFTAVDENELQKEEEKIEFSNLISQFFPSNEMKMAS